MANQLSVLNLARNSQANGLSSYVEVDSSTAAYVDMGGVDASKLLLQVSYNGADTGAEYLVKDGGFFTGGGIGDLKLTYSTGGDTFFVGPFESHRFVDSSTQLNIEGTADGSTSSMSFRAVLLP
jgi:hypothetical protein